MPPEHNIVSTTDDGTGQWLKQVEDGHKHWEGSLLTLDGAAWAVRFLPEAVEVFGFQTHFEVKLQRSAKVQVEKDRLAMLEESLPVLRMSDCDSLAAGGDPAHRCHIDKGETEKEAKKRKLREQGIARAKRRRITKALE